MEDWNPAVVKMLNIFMPTTFERRAAVKAESRFVHYTTAENLFRILDRQEVWFRNTRCMNDHRDVEHGIAQMNNWINDAAGDGSLFQALEICLPGAWGDALKKYQHWLPSLRTQSYVLSVSEQDPAENAKGRLAMWRAYDKGTVGVAVVVDVAPFMQMTEALKAYPSPVAYWTRQQFEEEFELIAQRIMANREFVSQLQRNQLIEIIFLMLVFAATCAKHPGLSDEREWRVLTNPLLWPSTQLAEHQHIIGGIPQTVYRMPLKDNPAVGLTGIELPALIDHVIIGPTQHAGPIRDALVAKLAERGVEDPWSKVFASGLPVRPSSMGETLDSR